MIPTNVAIEWDVVNWSCCLRVWDPHVSAGPYDCLEVGCGKGGLSLWLASKGHRVICSDLKEPGSAARELHAQYGVSGRIRYEAIDATRIPYAERFDVIVCKSVMGGIWAKSGIEGLQRSICGIHKSLRPDGKLLFVENLRATSLHMFCRKRLLHRADVSWKYFTESQMLGLLRQFSDIQYELAGFLGTFGRTERQRTLLGHMDRFLTPILPRSWRYLMAGVATK